MSRSQQSQERLYTDALSRDFDREGNQNNICAFVEEVRTYCIDKNTEYRRIHGTSIGYTFNVLKDENPPVFDTLCKLVSEYKKTNGLKATDKLSFIEDDCFNETVEWPSKQFPHSLISHLNKLSPNPRQSNQTARGKKHRSRKQRTRKTRRF